MPSKIVKQCKKLCCCKEQEGLKLRAQILGKNEKMKIQILSRIKRGTRGEIYMICFVTNFNTSIFYFGISNCFEIAKEEFQKNFNYRGIELIIWKILLICNIFFFVF